MPRLFNLYVVGSHRLPDARDERSVTEALRNHGALWAQVEDSATGFLQACDEIGEILGCPAVRGAIGTYSPEDAAAIHRALSLAPRELVDRIDSDDRLATAYWGLHDTSEEAVERGACMVIQCVG
ncbi:MAG: hypothetical protein F9K40_05700 [Kofleriaceae bacterium]|nr:MAG: hypothetical protein F9K40_05700 [Kofleriaceae bacterium]